MKNYTLFKLVVFVVAQSLFADEKIHPEQPEDLAFPILPVAHARIAVVGDLDPSITGDPFEFGDSKYVPVNAAFDEIVKKDLDSITVTINSKGEYELEEKHAHDDYYLELIPSGEPLNEGSDYPTFEGKHDHDLHPIGHGVKCADCKKKKGAKCCIKDDLKIKLIEIYDKREGAVKFEMFAVFFSDSVNCCNECCEYRQYVKSSVSINGAPQEKNWDGTKFDPNNYQHETYKRGDNSPDNVYSPLNIKHPDKKFEQYKGFDIAGYRNKRGFVRGTALSGFFSFKGVVYDTCKNENAGKEIRLGFNIGGGNKKNTNVGKTPNVVVKVWGGFSNINDPKFKEKIIK